jgi:hypothetical protein
VPSEKRKVKIVWIALCLLLLPVTSLPCHAQNPAADKASRQAARLAAQRAAQRAAQYERYAKPVDWTECSRHLFKDSETSTVFTLKTSWIPGADHKGMFRYIMSAFPKQTSIIADTAKNPELDSPKKIEDFVKRVNSCTINLVLHDTDGFLLRKIPVEFSYKVGEDAHISSLAANDSDQMDAEEYKKFLGDSPMPESWSVTWACY